MSAELAARISAAAAVLADFRHALERASLAAPPDPALWCGRLARALGDLLEQLEL